MAAETVVQHASSFIDIPLALLDWPCLLFVLLLLFGYHFRDKIVGLLERGDIQISWGKDKHIKLKDLSDGIDQELDPLREEIQEVKKQLQVLMEQSQKPGEEQPVLEKGRLDAEARKAAESKILDGLKNHQYRWRSLDKLAGIAGITEADVQDIIVTNKDIVQSIGKSGKTVAKFKDK